MKNLVFKLLALSAVATLTACSSAPVVLYSNSLGTALKPQEATIELQKVLLESKEGKLAKQQLDAEFAAYKRELDPKKEAAKTREERFSFKEEVNASQRRLEASEKAKVAPIIEKINKLIVDIAKKRGYTRVIDDKPTEGIPDISDEVLKRLDSGT